MVGINASWSDSAVGAGSFVGVGQSLIDDIGLEDGLGMINTFGLLSSCNWRAVQFDFVLGIKKGPDLVIDLASAMGTKRECGLLAATLDLVIVSK